MTDALDPPVIDYAQYLAALPDQAARKRTQKAVNHILVASLPDDEVGKPPVRSLGEYLDDDIELPPMLVEPGFVARGALTVLSARGGKGKTTVSLNRLMRWAMGKPMFDELPDVMKPIEPLKVLLIENEGAPGHFQRVLNTILTANGHSTEEMELARKNVSIWGNGGWSGLKLDDPANLALVRRACELLRPDILFLEPFRGLWKGSEMDDVAMSNVLDEISGIANEFDLGAMVTHHERKSGHEGEAMDALRGSTVFEGHAAVIERWAPAKGHDQRELSTSKNRFNPEPPPPIRMEFELNRWGYRLVEEAEKMRAVVQVLRSLAREDYLTIGTVAEEAGETYQTTRNWLNKACDAGHAAKKTVDRQVCYRYKPSEAERDDDSSSMTIT